MCWWFGRQLARHHSVPLRDMCNSGLSDTQVRSGWDDTLIRHSSPRKSLARVEPGHWNKRSKLERGERDKLVERVCVSRILGGSTAGGLTLEDRLSFVLPALQLSRSLIALSPKFGPPFIFLSQVKAL